MFMLEKTIKKMKIWIILLISCFIACNGKHASEKKQVVNQPQTQALTNCDSCKIDNYRYLLFDSTSYAAVRIHTFLLCLNKECSKDIEFSEFSSDLLYGLLEERADLILSVLKENKDINLDYVLFVLENPIYEDTDINNTISRIKNAQGDEAIKESLIKSLQIALNNI